MICINIKNKWLCYFFFRNSDLMSEQLNRIGCSDKEINKANEIMQSLNSGFTYTNMKEKTSVVGISVADSKEQWFNTLVHELKHIQSHICDYYDIPEHGEEAAYLIGYLMQIIIYKLR